MILYVVVAHLTRALVCCLVALDELLGNHSSPLLTVMNNLSRIKAPHAGKLEVLFSQRNQRSRSLCAGSLKSFLGQLTGTQTLLVGNMFVSRS